MAFLISDAEVYFATQVLHNKEWVDADPETKNRALANAEAQLYRIYKNYTSTDKPLPNEAVFEQAIWLLRIDDSIQKAEQGVKTISVDGITVSVDRVNIMLAPQVFFIIGRRVGRTVTE